MRHLFIFLFTILLVGQASAQRFSKDPAEFARQARQVLLVNKTEAFIKLAYDFETAWNSKFQQAHKEKAMQIAQGMRKRGYVIKPHFDHLFGYMANAVMHKGIQADQLHNLLDINLQALKTLDKREYADFLYELNTFFGNRELHRSNNIFVQANGGTFSFELVGAAVDTAEVALDPEPEEEEPDDGFITDEDLQTELAAEPSNDDWGSDDDWGGSGWGNDDDWGSDDDWGTGDEWAPVETPNTEPEPAPSTYVPVTTSYVTLAKARYSHPEIQGPVIHLKDIQLQVVTPYDSFRIKNVDGEQLLSQRTFAGESGLVEWPGQNTRTRGIEVKLEQFSLKVDRANFWTPNAKATFPGLFDGEVEGAFYWKSIRRRNQELSKYPKFISYESDVKVDLGEKMQYVGGIAVEGDEVFGESISRKRGTLTVLDAKGRTAVFRGRKFVFGEDVVRSEAATVTLKFDGDSIYHESVAMRYDRDTEEMTIYRRKNLNTSPFVSSFHSVTLQTDLIRWTLGADSLTLSTMNGKELVPTIAESFDFYNKIRYEKLNGIFTFHPISAFVFYARKYNTEFFYINEIAAEYDIDPNMATGAAVMLKKYGFATFDRETGRVELMDKSFHFYDAASKKKDYDNMMIPSISPAKPNAVLDLDSLGMKMSGVDRFFVTTDFQVEIKPKDGDLVLGENRQVVFDGQIKAGEFVYTGRGFEFDYGAFLITMPNIDSMAIEIDMPDSLRDGAGEKEQLQNQLTGTSGILYLDQPGNKSGQTDFSNYPYFSSESDAIVYFDGPEILNGAYDRSVFFVVPPLQMDSMNAQDQERLFFPGTFNSGGIFPTFEDTLAIMPDKSLGFVHETPPSGYNLYGTPAKTYEEITLDHNGMMGSGEIDFLKTRIYSKDFIFYPDSVTADGEYGSIEPGNVGNASYPQAELGRFRMYWLPRKDSMYLKTVNDPFKFYHGTANLVGEANITQKGVYGSGEMLTRGSRAISKDFAFRELSYSARHADFVVLTDNPEKPAMQGEDIRLEFDLVLNSADVTPENRGEAAISFPYAQFKTSITNAKWDLEDSVITMTKPDGIPLQDSYFYTTRADLDSLAFSGTEAIYDINSYELKIEGIPYIEVADAMVIPENNETTILENSKLQPFQNAQLIFEYPNAKHTLDKGHITIDSRNVFRGYASYQLPIFEDTFAIEMRNFMQVESAPVEEKGLFAKKQEQVEPPRYTVADGTVSADQNLKIANGFLYKGSVNFKAYKQALELVGYVKPDLQSKPGNDFWVSYSRLKDTTEVAIDMTNATLETGERPVSGIHYDIRGDLYGTIVELYKTPGDLDFFKAKGVLSYNPDRDQYIIEENRKSNGQAYEGHMYVYSDSTGDITFEGNVDFFQPGATKITLESTVVGEGNLLDEEFSVDAMMALDLGLPNQAMDAMAEDMVELILRLGNPPANDLDLVNILKIANFIGEEKTREYETESLKEYVALNDMDQVFDRSLLLSTAKLDWSKEHKAWYNSRQIGVSNIFRTDINAKMDGFLEIKKDATGSDIFNLFLQTAPGSWYYFNYQDNSILSYSSNSTFNEIIEDKSNFGDAKPGELVIIPGDENETLKFLNEFRQKYFGIEEPYNLVYPEDGTLEEENFETIEKDDDGFGF